jgi:hypothetical protein
MGLENLQPWWLRPERGATEWLIEVGITGWPFSSIWKWIPDEAITKVETTTKD